MLLAILHMVLIEQLSETDLESHHSDSDNDGIAIDEVLTTIADADDVMIDLILLQCDNMETEIRRAVALFRIAAIKHLKEFRTHQATEPEPHLVMTNHLHRDEFKVHLINYLHLMAAKVQQQMWIVQKVIQQEVDDARAIETAEIERLGSGDRHRLARCYQTYTMSQFDQQLS